jgi:hypothetical protein
MRRSARSRSSFGRRAVGEGSVVVSYIHRYLAEHRNEFSVEGHSTLAALRNVDEAIAGAKA